jgi:hypothetical protein
VLVSFIITVTKYLAETTYKGGMSYFSSSGFSQFVMAALVVSGPVVRQNNMVAGA